ncbi:MAG: type IV pilus secretin PilQ family protein [Pseudomonadales bacterium]|jgi:type IV pilus assembly protein PilQ
MQALMKFWLPTLALMLSAQVQARPVVLTDLDVQSLDSERIEIRLAFDGDAPEARSYSVNDPARIAVDLDQTGSALDKRYFQIGSEKVSGVTVVEAGARTRLIVNLSEMMPFDIQSQANQLVLALGGPVVAAPALQAPVPLTAAVDSKIQDVDFRRGDEGEGLVQINLSTASVTPDIEQQGQVVRIRFPGVELPGELARRLDVVDFGTPVQRIDAFSEEGDTVIAVRPQGSFDYLAFQTDTLFTLAVSRLTTQEQKLLEETQKYTGETLSLNFQDIEVRKVLNLIADFTNLNLVASDTVGGNITLRLQDVPWDQALDLVLRTKGLDKRQVGNVLLVAPAEEIAAREQLELENQRAAQELAPLRTEFIQVQYSKAADIAGLLTGNSVSGAAEAGDSSVLLTARGSVAVDERTNTLIVQDTAAKLQEVRDLMQVLDVPVRQVMIEARIVTAESSFSERIGVRWGAFASDNLGNSGIGASIGSGFDGGALGTATQGLNVDLVPAGAQKGAFSLGLAANDVQLNLELNALEAEGRGEVVAQPKIVTADQSPASIQQGAQIPYSTVSDGGTNVQFQNAVLSLDVTPQITPDGNVIMELAIAQDSVGGTTSDGQIIIDTRKLNTTVLVGDGETIVLGGVFEETNNNDVEKVPVLGDLPLLGKLFRNKVVIEDKKELLVFITPKLINDALARR